MGRRCAGRHIPWSRTSCYGLSESAEGDIVNRFYIGILTGFCAFALLADTDRGVELYKQGKYADAQSELAKAVQGNPDDARARRYLGLALVEQHKPGDAVEHLNKANDLD